MSFGYESIPDFVDWQSPINWGDPLNRGLVEKYIAVEGGGFGGSKWLGLVNGNHGTLTNMTSGYGWQGALGRPGGWGAMRFSSSVSNYIAVANSAELDFTTTYTINAWIYPFVQRNFETIAVRGNSSGNSDIEIYVAGAGAQALTIVHNRFNGGSFSVSASNGQPVANMWTMITIVHSSPAIKIYYNGKLSFDKTIVAPIATGKGWYFGFLPLVGNYSNQSQDDISLYNRALSAAEVAGLYEASMNHYPTQLNRFAYRPRYVPSGFNPAFNPAWAARSTITLQPGICVGAA